MRYLLILLLIALAVPVRVWGHDARYESRILREWKLEKPCTLLKASYFLSKNGQVYLEDAGGRIHCLPENRLSGPDREFVAEREEKIRELNAHFRSPVPAESQTAGKLTLGLLVLSGAFCLAAFFRKKEKSWGLLTLLFWTGGSACLFSFQPRGILSSLSLSPQAIDSAFVPFKPKVYTRWDQNWFYVESKGMADHEMMTGITKWQQQVPIPQCYTGSNAWQIPLNPVMAASPIPVNNQHFLRGAIAIAVNGIPIFNPYTNTGVDALLDGQLDNWGGHSGRADDYHYHIAPVHLYAQSNPSLPIAFGLDGFPVYGSTEPDGSPVQPLDEFHGHMGSNGVFHYHGTPSAPYMIAKMKGQVTEDATLQIIPQPSAHGVRPSGTPLSGATITGFTPNGTGNGFNMTYSRAGQSYAWNYSWTPSNVFTFNYVSPSGTTTTSYNGQAPCTLPVSVQPLLNGSLPLLLFPNPAGDHICLSLQDEQVRSRVLSCAVFSAAGKECIRADGFQDEINLRGLPAGSYRLRISTTTGPVSFPFTIR